MAEAKPLTLRALQRAVKQTLDERFALPVWVTAEISEIKVNYSGHCYLELIEKGSKEGLTVAQARAVIWQSHYLRIAAQFKQETGEVLTAGMQILAKVLVTYHEIYGFSLQITDIDPAFTLGDLERQRQQTIAQLQQDGIWEMNRSIVAPTLLQRLAVVSSPNAAGYRDFMKELGTAPYRFRTTLFEATMQGTAAADSIIEALCRIADRSEEFDAVVLIRGGGSRIDLACFDDYRLCCYIAQHPLPVITGIGHDKDTSVADMVAHVAMKTPTAVAGWFIERLAAAEATLEQLALALSKAFAGRTRQEAVRLERLQAEVRNSACAYLATRRVTLDHLATRPQEVARERLRHAAQRLDRAHTVAEAHDPARLLGIGYALVHQQGELLRSAARSRPGDTITVTLKDGEIQATVNDVTIWQRKS